MVSFRTGPTSKGSEKREQFKQLVGADYLRDGELQKPSDAPDPRHHALAYYRYILDLSTDELHDAWHEARKKVAEVRNEWPDDHELDDMEIQGLQTIVWGYTMIRQFASTLEIDPDLVWDETELRQSLRHVVSEVGPDGQRKSHLDEWVELVERAAAMDYLEQGTHYSIVHEGKRDEQLRLNGRKTFDAVSKYLRDHGLERADVLSDWQDYHKRFAEAAEDGDGYVQEVSIPTAGIGRAVGISTVTATSKLDFDRQTFDLEQMNHDKTPQSDLLQTLKSTIRTHAAAGDSKFAEKKEILNKVAKNHDRERVENGLEKLQANGAVIEPKHGKLVVKNS